VGGFTFVALLVLSFVLLIWGERFEVILDEAELQAKVEEPFPIEKQYLLFQVTLKEPKVHLLPDANRLEVEMQIGVKVKGLETEFRGLASVTGRIRYLPEKASFFLDDPQVQRLKLPGIPERFTSRANELVELALREWYERFPIYRLKEGRFKHEVARLVLQKMEVRNQKLILTLGVGP
jgi:hypothetical protein